MAAEDIRDIDGFGAKGDCVYDKEGRFVSGADDTDALKAAFSWQQAKVGRKLLGSPGAIYQLRDTVSGQGDVLVDWRGAEVFKTTSGDAFRFDAPFEFSPLSTAPEGGVLMVNGLSRAPAGGDAVMILSDAIDPFNRDEGDRPKQFRVAEWVIVGDGATARKIPVPYGVARTLGVDPKDPNLSIGRVDERVITRAFSPDFNARVMLVDRRRVDWRNLTLRFEGGHGASADEMWRCAGLLLSGYVGAVRNMGQIRGYGPSIQLAGCFKLLVERCSASDLEDNTRGRQYGYGLADASFLTRAVGCEWSRCRHGFTTTQVVLSPGAKRPPTYAAAGSQAAEIENCTGSDFPTNAPFDTHHGARDTVFHNCRAISCKTYAYTIRGRDIQIVDPFIRQTATGFFTFTGYASGSGPAEDFFLAAAGPEFRTKCAIRGGDIETTGPILRRQYSETLFAGIGRMASPDPRMVHGPGIVIFSGYNNAKDVGGGLKAFVEHDPVEGKGAAYVRESRFIIRPGGFVDADYSNAVFE